MPADPCDALQQQREHFARVSSREQLRLFRYIFTLVPNVADAEEVLQNTNLVLWQKFSEFDPGSSFIRWACSVAHIEAHRFRQRRQRDQRVFSVDFFDQIAAEITEQAEALDARHDALLKCLAGLRETDRELIFLRYAEGATTQSVAQKLRRPLKSIYNSINRIRDALMECINRRLAVENR